MKYVITHETATGDMQIYKSRICFHSVSKMKRILGERILSSTRITDACIIILIIFIFAIWLHTAKTSPKWFIKISLCARHESARAKKTVPKPYDEWAKRVVCIIYFMGFPFSTIFLLFPKPQSIPCRDCFLQLLFRSSHSRFYFVNL